VVVDDEEPCRELLVARVRMSGHVPRAFDSPFAALLAIGEQVPDVVVTDFNMPGLDGLELSRRIRDAGWRPRPYIILTSATVELDDSARVRHAGADAFVPKSISLNGFEAALRAAGRALCGCV
jgi:CheY-like chemotaxis protein